MEDDSDTIVAELADSEGETLVDITVLEFSLYVLFMLLKDSLGFHNCHFRHIPRR